MASPTEAATRQAASRRTSSRQATRRPRPTPRRTRRRRRPMASRTRTAPRQPSPTRARPTAKAKALAINRPAATLPNLRATPRVPTLRDIRLLATTIRQRPATNDHNTFLILRKYSLFYSLIFKLV